MSAADTHGVVLKSALTKPVTPSTLLEAIGEVLGKGNMVETRASEKADQHAESMAHLRGARVLLVEDNELNQELGLELLRSAGMQVELAANGQEALDWLARDAAFDGVLMDCQMPVMDGYEATREIRKNPAWQQLPVIAMTANAMADDRDKAIAVGMNDHIAKPLNIGEMFSTLARWIVPAHPVGAGPAVSSGSPAPVIPILPGIDTAAGLATTMQNAPLYLKLLQKFRDSQTDFARQFAVANQDADRSAPLRLAHSLKGTAGNIGARELQAAAGELELACKNERPPAEIEARLQAVRAALAPVLAGLQGITGGTVVTEERAATDSAEVTELLAVLRHRLEESDSEAADALAALLPLVQGTPLALPLKEVARAIDAFDFDAALAAILKISYS